MKSPKTFWRVLTSILVGSAMASRATTAPSPPEVPVDRLQSEWDVVRQELELSTIAAALPDHVRRHLPSEADGSGPVDLAAAVRLSYAAADGAGTEGLDAYWRAYPALDAEARGALDSVLRLRTGTGPTAPGFPPVDDGSEAIRLAQSKPGGGGYT